MNIPNIDIGVFGKFFILIIIIFLLISQVADCDFSPLWDSLPFMGPGNRGIRVLG